MELILIIVVLVLLFGGGGGYWGRSRGYWWPYALSQRSELAMLSDDWSQTRRGDRSRLPGGNFRRRGHATCNEIGLDEKK